MSILIIDKQKYNTLLNVLEDLGEDDIALGPHLEVNTGHRFLLLSVVLVQDLLVLQGTTKSTRKKSQLLNVRTCSHVLRPRPHRDQCKISKNITIQLKRTLFHMHCCRNADL